MLLNLSALQKKPLTTSALGVVQGSIPSPYVIPTAQQLIARQEKIRATPKTPLQQLIATSKPIQKVADVLKTAFVGKGQDVDIAGNLKFDTGILGLLRPFGIGKPREQKAVERIDLLQPLVDSGEITPQRVEEIVQNTIAQEGVMNIQKGVPIQKPKLTLTSSEKSALRPVVIEETLDKVFGALDFISLGTIKPITRTAAQKIAESKIGKEIADILMGEIPALDKETADVFGKVLTQVDNVDDVQMVLNRTKLATQAKRPLNTTALQAPVSPESARTAPTKLTGKDSADRVQEALKIPIDQLASKADYIKPSDSFKGAKVYGFYVDGANEPLQITVGANGKKISHGYDYSAYNNLAPITPKVENIPELQPLVREAQKYSSAEEFVKAQTPVYRGVEKGVTDFRPSSGGKFFKSDAFSVTTDKVIAKNYGAYGEKNNVVSGFIDKNAKIKNIGELADIREFTHNNLANEIKKARSEGYDGIKGSFFGRDETIILNKDIIKTKSQLTDFYNKVKETPSIPKKRVVDENLENLRQEISVTEDVIADMPGKGAGKFLNWRTDEFKKGADVKFQDAVGQEVSGGGDLDILMQQREAYQKAEARYKQLQQTYKNAKIVTQDEKILNEMAGRVDRANERLANFAETFKTKSGKALSSVYKKHGSTERIIESLRKADVTEAEISDIVLEDGTKLVDTVKVKRETNGALSAVITKQQLADIKTSYKGNLPTEKWVKRSVVKDAIQFPNKVASIYEVPQVYFERKGLKESIYDPIREAQRGASQELTNFVNRFKDAGFAKKGGWFTANRFTITEKESRHIGEYILTRQGKGYNVSFDALTPKEKKFVEIFDGIIKETEPRFFEVAKKNGKEPGKVENYAPIMTRGDIELIDKGGDMDFIVRKHPAFFSTKERVEKVPVELYETDYREVVSRWLSGVTKFNALGDISPEIKYLVDSEEFKALITNRDHQVIHDWYRSVMTPDIPKTEAVAAVNFVSRLLRKSTAIASLGLNYASVIKQALTQIPLTLIEKAPPKLRSQFAKAFDIKVADLPSITERKGDIAIADLQGKIGRIFTGALTKFDQLNAQKSLNALLDKEYNKFLKTGAEVGEEQKAYILKQAQDRLDLWYGGMTKEQLPPAFRQEIGRLINMFILPLTSQLNGFFQHIAQAKGAGGKSIAVATVLTSATIIAYLEQSVTQLSPEWSDKKQMATDILQSLLGNIPIVSQISYALASDQPVEISAGTTGISNLLGKINDASKGNVTIEEFGFALAETVGLPKQIRRIREGIEIISEGGIRDKNGKMLAPVTEADEYIRSFLRGKYGSLAAKDWIRNIGEKTENREWFVPQVEFLQNGDYERKAELYKSFTPEEQKVLRDYLSEGQQKKLDKALKGSTASPTSNSLEGIFGGQKKSLESIFSNYSDSSPTQYRVPEREGWRNPEQDFSGQKISRTRFSIKDSLLNLVEKLPFVETRLAKKIRDDALNAYSFTPKIRKMLEEKTFLTDESTITDDALQLNRERSSGESPRLTPKGSIAVGELPNIYGGESHPERMQDVVPLGDFLPDSYKYKTTGGKNQIHIKEWEPHVVAHELSHAIIDKRGFKYPVEEFNSDWEKAKKTDSGLLNYIDEKHIKGNPELYHDMDAFDLANERFAYLVEYQGELQNIPPTLQRHYVGILDNKSVSNSRQESKTTK